MFTKALFLKLNKKSLQAMERAQDKSLSLIKTGEMMPKESQVQSESIKYEISEMWSRENVKAVTLTSVATTPEALT